MVEVPYTVKFIGFYPDPQLSSYVRFLMFKVMDYCPYDSAIDLQVLALSNLFLVNIDVKYVHEKFQGSGEFATVEVALELAEKALYGQIQVWRELRFNDQRMDQRKQPAQKISVLLVDDDPISTKLIETCLNKQGCEVYQVNSGDEAVFTIKNHAFSFVVMDWNMRPLNGRQTLKILDSTVNVNKGIHRPKIPVLTYSVNEQDEINFPRTENLYQFAHLSKTSSLQSTFDATKKLVDQFNGHTH